MHLPPPGADRLNSNAISLLPSAARLTVTLASPPSRKDRRNPASSATASSRWPRPRSKATSSAIATYSDPGDASAQAETPLRPSSPFRRNDLARPRDKSWPLRGDAFGEGDRNFTQVLLTAAATGGFMHPVGIGMAAQFIRAGRKPVHHRPRISDTGGPQRIRHM